jgi:hypothetical protein
MAGHELIAAQLDILARRLPAQAVQELADGLAEAYEAQLAALGDPGAAARAAITEFGDAEVITAAFVRDSPWRRTAMALLATGPVMAALWAVTLISARMWTWPIAPPLRSPRPRSPCWASSGKGMPTAEAGPPPWPPPSP